MTMREIPIIFSGPNVRATLDGRKTQHRVVLKPQPSDGRWGNVLIRWSPGDRLCVRETWSEQGCCEGEVFYRATIDSDTDYTPEEIVEIRWRSSTHMPKWVMRITLEVKAIRVERLQDISESDALAEGAPQCVMDDDANFYQDDIRGTFRCGFAGLWNHFNGSGAWDANPWVAVIEFERVAT